MNSEQTRRDALCWLYRLWPRYGHAPFWLPKNEAPPMALSGAVHHGWLIHHNTAGFNVSIQITAAGGRALADYKPAPFTEGD